MNSKVRPGGTTDRPALDPLPYTPPGYQWIGCRSAYPVLRGRELTVFAPRMGYSQNMEDYA